MRLRQLFEEPRTAVIAFGRMNPPTIGHQKLVDKIKSIPGDPYVFLSQSQKPKTDPLAFEDKLRYAKFFFPEVSIGHPEVKTIIQALKKISDLGYDNLIYVAGSDRVQAFEELINKYNGSDDYSFKNIQVVSAGERDPDADGAEGMSASKMRQAAADNDLESFKQGVPREEVADEMFAAVRQGMGIKDAVPAESITETVDEAEWYVLTANRGDRLTGPLDNNAAQQQAMVYPAKPPQIGPAPEGFKTVIAQSKSNSLNMAMRKAQLQVKKIYAKQFGNNVQNLRITMNEIKYGGRAVDANGKNYIATVSAHIKIQSQQGNNSPQAPADSNPSPQNEGWFSSDDPIEMPSWLNDKNKALWRQLNPIDDGSIRAKRLITQLQSLNRFATNGLTDTANDTLANELQRYQQLESIQTDERELSRDERRSREVNFRKLKKHRSDFEKRYGDDAESVMYAVATKRAKGESIEEEENSWISNAWNTLKHGFDDPMTTDYIPFILKNIRRYGDRRTEQMLMRQFPNIKPVDAKRAMRMALDALHKRG